MPEFPIPDVWYLTPYESEVSSLREYQLLPDLLL